MIDATAAFNLTDARNALRSERIEVTPLNRRAMVDALVDALEDYEGGYAPRRWEVEAGSMVDALLA